MKKLILLISLVIVGMTGMAQNSSSQVATLKHGDKIIAFYGMNAFVQAYEAADSADIISLSAGSFLTCSIDKSIRVFGVGYGSNEKATIILGNQNFNYGGIEGLDITFDGIEFVNEVSLYKITASFNNCFIAKLSSFTNSNATLNSCRIGDIAFGLSNNFEINNSIFQTKGDISSSATCMFTNCVYTLTGEAQFFYPVSSSNCFIFWKPSTGSSDSGLSVFNNCIVFTDETTDFSENPTSTVKILSLADADNVFTDYNSDCNDLTSTYKIKEDVKSDYTFETAQGTDEIGIYGGLMPFGSIHSNPQITKFVVDPRSNSEGKLNIQIEVGN